MPTMQPRERAVEDRGMGRVDMFFILEIGGISSKD